MGYYLVPQTPTSDKEELINFVAGVFIQDVEAVYGRKGIEMLKSFNNAQLLQIHEESLREYEYLLANYIKKSRKQCYGGSMLFGLSSTENNQYITDLRKAIQKFKGSV